MSLSNAYVGKSQLFSVFCCCRPLVATRDAVLCPKQVVYGINAQDHDAEADDVKHLVTPSNLYDNVFIAISFRQMLMWENLRYFHFFGVFSL